MSNNHVFRFENEECPLFDTATAVQQQLPGTSIQVEKISMKPILNDGTTTDESRRRFVEDMKSMVIDMCREILAESSSDVMNLTELSTIISSYVGSEITQFIQENYDGLLFLLKNYPDIFRVQNTAVGSTISLVSRYVDKFQFQQYQPSSTINAFSSNERFSQTCLHIGNVPPNMGEIQLQREFEQFGPVESVNVYTQRPRKYAFISFFSAEDALQAKLVLSKKFPWKSAISFARKENPAKLKTMYGGHSPQLQYGLGGIHNDFSFSNSTSGSSTPQSPVAYDNYGSVININDNPKIYEENYPVGKLLRGTSASSIGSNYSQYSNSNNYNYNNNIIYNTAKFNQGNRPRSFPTTVPVGPDRGGLFVQQNYKTNLPVGSISNNRQYYSYNNYDSNTNMNLPLESNNDPSVISIIESMSTLGFNNNNIKNNLNQQNSSYGSSVAATSSSNNNSSSSDIIMDEQDVLQKLCNISGGSCSPLKNWSINMSADFPICEVIINILHEFGGIIPLEDLTILLSHRLPVVPLVVNVNTLKAFVQAYPGFFMVSGKDEVILCL